MVTLSPLASSDLFKQSAYADMARKISGPELDRIMMVATRACESSITSRVAPFEITETTRLQDGDVEDVLAGSIPMTHQAQMGMDYSRALGIPAMVRNCSVRNYPKQFPELWTGAIVSVKVSWALQPAPFNIPLDGLAFFPDTGRLRFNVGAFVPPGSTGIITYTGGYTSVPEDLEQACLCMAAAALSKMLDPRESDLDPAAMRREAIEYLVPYGARPPRSGKGV